MSNWYSYLSVQLVLVPDVGRICAGAERSRYICWVNFQHTLAEHLALLLVVRSVVS